MYRYYVQRHNKYVHHKDIRKIERKLSDHLSFIYRHKKNKFETQ